MVKKKMKKKRKYMTEAEAERCYRVVMYKIADPFKNIPKNSLDPFKNLNSGGNK